MDESPRPRRDATHATRAKARQVAAHQHAFDEELDGIIAVGEFASGDALIGDRLAIRVFSTRIVLLGE